MNLAAMSDKEIREAWLSTSQRQALERSIMLKSQREQYDGLCETHINEAHPLVEEMRKRELFWKPQRKQG